MIKNRIVSTVTAAAILGASALAGGAAAAERAGDGFDRATAQTFEIRMARVQQNASRKGSGGLHAKNVAPAWTAACHAEFGPNATHPDPRLLQKCLNWGA